MDEEKYGVFIIENDTNDYKSIKNLLLPSNCISLCEFIGLNNNQKPDENDLLPEEAKAIQLFSENHQASLKKSEKYVERIILEHQDSLRMIICDLQINGKNEGGKQLIKAIKALNTSNNGNNWFARQIPILILSGMTHKTIIDAAKVSIGSCFYFTKTAAFKSFDIIQDVITTMVSDFNAKYKEQKYMRTYKVALSFTDSNIDSNNEEVHFRDYIEEIAHVLYGEYRKEKVLYDEDNKPVVSSLTKEEFAELYNDSEYIVVFLTKNYVNKTSSWVEKEWSVIKELVPQRRVLFVKLDNNITSDDFENELGIQERLYDDLVASCSKYNGIIRGKDDNFKKYLYDNCDKKPIIEITEKAIEEYRKLLRKEINDAAKFIIDSIRLLDQKRE